MEKDADGETGSPAATSVSPSTTVLKPPQQHTFHPHRPVDDNNKLSLTPSWRFKDVVTTGWDVWRRLTLSEDVPDGAGATSSQLRLGDSDEAAVAGTAMACHR